jgi:hypothetical protein
MQAFKVTLFILSKLPSTSMSEWPLPLGLGFTDATSKVCPNIVEQRKARAAIRFTLVLLRIESSVCSGGKFFYEFDVAFQEIVSGQVASILPYAPFEIQIDRLA